MRSRLLLAVCLVAACKSGGATDGGGGTGTPGPHCTRPSTVACDQPAHRQAACVCDNGAQCESGFCALETKYFMHVCQWQPIPVALGERCDCGESCLAGTGCLEVCPSGAYCKDLGLESRCAPLEQQGGPCTYDLRYSITQQCEPPLECTLADGSTRGTCQPPPPQ